MKTIRFHTNLGAIILFLASSPLAQSADSPLPQSEPYVWQNVVMGGGGFVTGIIFHPAQKNLFYARTDVGGAYRWNEAQKKWIPLTDWLLGSDFTGIESLALDAKDTNRVYLAAGIYRSARAAILRSDDQGLTWEETQVPFKMGGNETGRFNGERLAVDPNDGRILFFGSRHDGLWRSSDRGITWNNVSNFPKIDTTEILPTATRSNLNFRFRGNSTPQQTGIVFVQFDSHSGSAGQPTPVIYVGVSTTGTNFFSSVDGGQNWESVVGQPMGLRPNHVVLAEDGMLFLTYGRQPGPTSMSDGAVWKFDPKKGAWTNITPTTITEENQPFGYGAISVDAKNSSNLVVTTFAHWRPHDEIFRSTNGGASWKRMFENAKWDFSSAPYTQKRTPHWMGTVQIDPFDSNHILFTTGYGVWACDNLADADAGQPTRWYFFDDGLEETVPLALISPPSGVHLLTGVGDIDGFRHEDLNVSPADGNFEGPRFSSTEDLAFAGKNPAIIVRSGSGGNFGPHAAISTDGGKTWNALASDPDGGASGAGSITISADGKMIVWTPRRAAPNFSSDNGKNWSPCAGLQHGIRVVADAVNPARFYAFDSQAGKFFASTNGAVNFSETEANLPASQGISGGTFSVAPGSEGDLWLATRAGVFHSTNAGNSFAKLENIQSANSIGFGMAAPGKNFPALFLIGEINNVSGVFRSDDNGSNWIRINDDRHQYGSISRVIGDPRIYGRVYFATSGRGVIYGDLVAETK